MTHNSPATKLAAAVLVCVAAAAIQGRHSAKSSDRYVFIESTDRWVGVLRGEWLLIGKLDKNGDFVHEQKLKAGEGWSAGVPASTLLNGGPAPKKVYEFRSGVLIPGELRKDGNFVPEVGGKIIAFADYKYTPEATPIWNVPGGFVWEKPPEPKK